MRLVSSTRAHDQSDPGLREYIALPESRPPRRPWLWLVVLAFLLGFALGTQVHAAEEPPVRFLQPRVPFVLAPPSGIEVPVQVRVARHPDNRTLEIAWCDGRHISTLDGDREAVIQPIAPLKVRLGPGDCAFAATVYAAGHAVRGRALFTMHVCGGQDDCRQETR